MKGHELLRDDCNWKKYSKIDGPYVRDPGTKKVMPGMWREEWMAYLSTCDWLWEEKVDGMNIRVVWTGEEVEFYGRTSKALIPGPLLSRLQYLFPVKNFEGEEPMILFGEGYGKGIQKGADYYPEGQDFILFDVRTERGWVPHRHEFYEYLLEKLNIIRTPIVGVGSLQEAFLFVAENPNSEIAENPRPMEGIVCRPMLENLYLAGKHGRLLVKIKARDFGDSK